MELQTIINQEMQVVGQGQALTVSSGPKSGEEIAFVEALKSKKIKDCSFDDLRPVLKYAMVKIGLRANNWPVEEEKAVLYHHIVANYAMHHLEEIRVAFDMAVNGSLDAEVNCYENFSCSYFSAIMNGYRKWAGEAYKWLIKDQPITKQMHPIDTRGLIEEVYQNTKRNDKLTYKLFPVHFYDQVVDDGYIHPQLYRDYMPYAKKEICTELQQQLSALIISSRPEDQPKIDRLQRQLNEYRAGTRDQEIITRAKQVSVWVLLQEARRRKLKGLYERVDRQQPSAVLRG